MSSSKPSRYAKASGACLPPECALCCAGQSAFCVKAASLCVHERGFSFFSVKRAQRETLATFTTLKRTPGISPTEWPLRPNPEINTSSCEKHTANGLATSSKLILSTKECGALETSGGEGGS